MREHHPQTSPRLSRAPIQETQAARDEANNEKEAGVKGKTADPVPRLLRVARAAQSSGVVSSEIKR